jgi:hypothetical protein
MSSATVEAITVEVRFRAHLPRVHDAVPGLVLMDATLRRASPRPGRSAPPDDVVTGR